MKPQINDRLNNASRNRRKRILALLVSTSLMAAGVSESGYGTEFSQPGHSSMSFLNSNSSMLKSVGIKFVNPAAQASTPAIAAPELAIPKTLPVQKTVTVAQEAFNVPHLATTEKTDRVEKTPVTPGVAAPTPQPSKVFVSEVEAKSIAAPPVLTMPPMIAGVTQQPVPTKAPEMGTVKINMTPDYQSKNKGVIQLPPLVASDKTVATKQASEVTEQIAVSAPSPPPSMTFHVEPDVKKEIQLNSSVQDLGLAVEKAVELPELKEAAVLLTETDIPKETAATTDLSVVEEPHQDLARSPSIVRIPSMTLSKKTVVQEPDSKPSLVAAPAETKPSLLTPPHESPLKMEVGTEPIVNRVVATAKSEPLSLQLPVESKPTVNLPDVVKDDQRQLASNEIDSKPDMELSETSQVSVSKTPTLYKAEPKIVAVPVSAVRESVALAMDDSSMPSLTHSSNGNSRPAKDEGNDTIEVVHRDVRCIKMAGSVEKVEVEDETICKGMVSDSKGITLIGVNRGTTRIKVWMASESTLPQSPQIFEVSVREAWTNTSHQSGMTINEATKSIAELFPTTRIAIKAHENGALIVFGKTDTNDQAKKIVAMVRKMFLVPVQDRIAIATP